MLLCRWGPDLSVLMGLGDGAFAPAAHYPLPGNGPHGIAVGDVDRDGVLDVAVANESTANGALLLGQGAGVLGAPALLAMGVTPTDLAFGDLDGATSTLRSRTTSRPRCRF